MREILFRGKKHSGEWIYGCLVNCFGEAEIFNPTEGGEIVDPETVGQFTGLTDKNGKKIFEGDLIVYDYDEPDIDGCTHSMPCPVQWDEEIAGFTALEPGSPVADTLGDVEWCVIGNIYDNPELLEAKENA